MFFPGGETGWEDKNILYRDAPIVNTKSSKTRSEKQSNVFLIQLMHRVFSMLWYCFTIFICLSCNVVAGNRPLNLGDGDEGVIQHNQGLTDYMY